MIFKENYDGILRQAHAIKGMGLRYVRFSIPAQKESVYIKKLCREKKEK